MFPKRTLQAQPSSAQFPSSAERLKVFFSYYKPHRRWLALDLACALGASAIALALPLLAGHITGTVLALGPTRALEGVYQVGALMLGLVIVYVACNTYVDYQGHMMGTVMEADLRRDLYAHLQCLPFKFYDRTRTGQLMSRLTNDLFAMGELYHHGPEDIAIGLLKFTGVFVILASINLPLTLIVFAFLPIMAVYGLYFNRRMHRAGRRTNERIADVNARIEDAINGIRVVQAFTNEPVEEARFALENRRFVDSRREWYKNEALFYEGTVALTQLISLAVIVFGAAAIVDARLRLEDLVVYLLCVGLLTDPIQRLVNFARLYQEAMPGFARFMEIMETKPEITDRPGGLEPERLRGEIEFRNVTFGYGEDAKPVLEGLNLKIAPGEFIALVGPSGVGKTTLCALIPRFYDVTDGQILLDGVDVRDYRVRALRAQIGVVQQDVYLFAGTVAENIRYGRLNATDAEVIQAAQRASAHDFIMALPQGYTTEVGQRGLRLSGGQRQRLSIARAFLKDPSILIFDEATSALDNDSERAVQRALEVLSSTRTTLVIAHRLSTVRNAARILVMTEAGIVEAGTHDALIAQGGVYASLYATCVSADGRLEAEGDALA